MYGYIVWFDDELNYIIGVIKYMNVWAALAAGASYIYYNDGVQINIKTSERVLVEAMKLSMCM